MSKMQERLEVAAEAVTEACKALVKLVRTISAKKVEEDHVDYKKNIAVLEFKKRKMEQQVEIMSWGWTRRLGAMRRVASRGRAWIILRWI